MGSTLLLTGQFAESRAHFDRAFAHYDPSKRATRDGAVMHFTWRAQAMWCLGHPEIALRDTHRALKDAREFGQAATLILALSWATTIHLFCRNYEAASSGIDELVALADEKGAVWWRAQGMILRGWLSSLTGKAADAVEMITSGLTAQRSTGTTAFMPGYLSSLARAYGDLGRFDDAWRSVDEAMTAVRTTKESWREADICHIAGEIALKSSEPDAAKAESHFERALTVARQQQAKSWELRASMSLARLYRDQGKVSEARELLAPVYGWFTEGFDTRDLKEAKALLDELAS
jgi:predicted ATPase